MALPENIFLHTFNLLPQLGPVRLLKLLCFFGSAKQAYCADAEAFRTAGLEPEVIELVLRHRSGCSPEAEAEKLDCERIRLLGFQDSDYPKLLKEIPKPPPLLYYKGVMENPEELCIAVIGTRKITNYGRVVTPELVAPLVDAGAVIVSGLAYGVDTAAHQVAIDRHGRSIAVVGGGLDEKSLYPKPHLLAAEQIVEHGGALLSEYPIGTPPLKHHFIARNRIISGLSVATLVVECDTNSGSLITARYALDQNRQLFAVPGPIYSSQSRGPNNLIKMGASIVTDAGDILSDLNLKALPQEQHARAAFGDSPAECALLALLTPEPVPINELIKQSGLQAGEAMSALTMLEMKGKTRNLGGQQYVLSR